MENKKVLNDQFYTFEKIAKQCIKEIPNIKSYTTIIEPSAGNGSFSKNIKGCLAFDIDPKDQSIKKANFLKLKFNPNWGNKILFYGNPPFGKRSTLAKLFIKQCIKLNATTIAFILPNIFKKAINQKENLFPKNWFLIKIIDLEKNSFFILDKNKKQNYGVPCSFFIWTKLDDLKKKYKNLRVYKINIKPKEFMFIKRGDRTADFTVNGNSGKVKELNQITNPKSEHYIKVINNFNVEKIKNKFKKLKYETFSSVNGGNYWINQNDIISAWNMQKNV